MITAGFPAPPTDGIPIAGSLSISFYALCILAGVAAAVWLSSKLWTSRGGDRNNISDAMIWALLFGIVGARLYHVISSPDAYFGENGSLAAIPQIWNGGISIIGAVLAGTIGVWIAARRYGASFGAFTDAIVPGVLLAQAIGRWGNWFNQELYGGPTNLPWGLTIDTTQRHQALPLGASENTAFHPTFLYESIWNLIGVAVLLFLFKRFQFKQGLLTWTYVAYYSIGRFWVESLRYDELSKSTQYPLSDWGIDWRLNMIVAFITFVVAIVMLLWLWTKRPRTEEALDAEMRIYVDRESQPSEAAPQAIGTDSLAAEKSDIQSPETEDSATENSAEEGRSSSTS